MVINSHDDNRIISTMTLEEAALCLGIITTVLSFSANSNLSRICSILMYAFWGVWAVLSFSHQSVSISRKVIYMVSVYAFIWLLTQVLYLSGVYTTNGLGPAKYLIMCAAFYFFGNNIQRNSDIVKRIVFAYAFAHIVFTALAFLLLFRSGTYTGKNMSGQALGIGIVLDFTIIPRLTKSSIGKVFFYFWGLFSLVTLWILHARTPFIAVLVVFLYLFFEKRRNLFAYFAFAIVILAFTVFFTRTKLGYEMIQTFLIGDLRYKEVELSNTEAIFSGRFDVYGIAFNDFFNHPFFGMGGWAYVDSFPIHALWVGGITHAILLIPFVYKQLFGCIIGFKKRTCNMNNDSCDYSILSLAKYLSLFYITVSLMEGYPPLGPGASAFFIWIVLGMKDSVIENEYKPVKVSER